MKRDKQKGIKIEGRGFLMGEMVFVGKNYTDVRSSVQYQE